MAIVKLIELVGSSPISWEEATKNALAEAAETVRNITWLRVVNQTAAVRDGKIMEYRSSVKIAFRVESARD